MNTANLRKLMRDAKNSINGYSDIQVLVREATSNDPWGPTTSLMRRIAVESENPVNYYDMFKTLWKRLTDFHHIKHVHKSLMLIDYLLKYGPEKIITDVRLRSDVVRKLCYYKYYKNGIESGSDVRSKSKAILGLLEDKELLSEQRNAAMSTNQRIIGFSYRDQRVDDAPSRKALKPRSMSSPDVFEDKVVSLISPVEEEVKESPRKPYIQDVYRKRANSVAQPAVSVDNIEDDLLSFARVNRRQSVNDLEGSGVFIFDIPSVHSSKPMLLFDESFMPGNEMALVPVNPVAPVSMFQDVDSDMALFDDMSESNGFQFEEEKPVEMETNMEEDCEEIPDDVWMLANINDIRITNSEKKRRAYAMKKKSMMKGKKLNQMEAKHKMEFDPLMDMPMVGTASVGALVPYAQAQQNYQMVPYGQRPAEQLYWN